MKFTEAFGQLQEWQALQREPVLECLPWLSLWQETIRLPDGREINDYYQLEQRDYVEIVTWQNGKVFGLWRYKHSPRRVNLGLPVGYLETDEDALAATRRELHEEAGLASDNWQQLGSYCIDENRGQARTHICVTHNCRSIEARPSDDLEEEIGEWRMP
jgi:ADP-ribose pyrophosphatase